MSASKVRNQDGMFHIHFPASRDFWNWTELGCLCRALGYPTELFRNNVTDEVESDEKGMYLQQCQKMIELKLLNQALHRSFNMHTSDWNLCVIRKAIRLLSLSILSFEEVHNIRVAYATYEAADMKGLILDQRILLRTLKMCHRVISPKKLTHRVKHMKSRLEEANRIQLYEFFDLILWCDNIEYHSEGHDVGEAEGKEKDLYKLVDFNSLLSHQDQRRSRALDQRYLQEEWDFGREQLGSRYMFRGEVVYTDQRIKQTRTQKKNYRGLKTAVSQSQRRVYRAHAGSIRQRPISAPDLSMYSTPRGTPRARTASAAAMYQSVQRRLHSADFRVLHSGMDLPERPALPEYVRAHTPSVVTPGDLDDVKLKMEMLNFDIATLETRCQVKKDEEMNFYIPEYQSPPTAHNSLEGKEKKHRHKAEHWTPDIVDNLAYPPYHLPAYHAHTCDARFRGWKPAAHKGRQKILTSPTYDNSPHGQLLAKQRLAMLAPVSDLHKDHVFRYTSGKEATEQQMTKRPCTAPAASPRAKPLKRLGCRSAGNYARRIDLEEASTTSKKTEDLLEDSHPTADDSKTAGMVKSYPDPYGKYSLESSGNSAPEEDSGFQESSPGAVNGQAPCRSHPDSSGRDEGGSCARKEDRSPPQVSGKNGPSRRHGGSKVVDVGLIGTITLLESIQEHETEDRLSSTISSSSPCSSKSSSPVQERRVPKDPEQLADSLDQSAKSIPAGWSRRHFSPEGKNQREAANVSSQERAGDRFVENGVSASGRDQGLRDAVSVPNTNQAVAETQKPRERGLQPNSLVGGQEKQNHGPSLNQKPHQSPGVKGGHPVRKGSAELRKPRVNSAASSALSDVSDPRDPHTPLTSVTVTIKNKNQHITSTRVNTGIHAQAEMAGNLPSPVGFKASSPCITSTPRRKRPTPHTANPPKDKQAGNVVNPNTRKTTLTNPANNPYPIGDPQTKPDSESKGLRKTAVNLLNSEANSASRLDWIQGQILAMNSARESDLPEDPAEKEAEEKQAEDHDEELSVDHAGEPGAEKKATIRFTEEQILIHKREAAYRRALLSRKASEGALKLKSFDLNAETARRFTFNKATTRRLLHRVQDVISPELKSRIRTGDTGLRVI